MKKLFIVSLVSLVVGLLFSYAATTRAFASLNGEASEEENLNAVLIDNFESIDHPNLQWDGKKLNVAKGVNIRVFKPNGASTLKGVPQVTTNSNLGEEFEVKGQSQAVELKVKSVKPDLVVEESSTRDISYKIKMSKESSHLWKKEYVRVDGDKLTLFTEDFEQNCESISVDPDLQIKISVPRSTQIFGAELVSGTMSGAVSVDEAFFAGVSTDLDLQLSGSSADINLVSGDARLETSVQKLSVKVVSSDIKMINQGSKSRVDLKSVSGDVDIDSQAELRSVEFNSVSGDLTLRAPQKFEFAKDFEKTHTSGNAKAAQVLSVRGECVSCEIKATSF